LKFNGTIDKVTIELRETKNADLAEAQQASQEGALKKRLSD